MTLLVSKQAALSCHQTKSLLRDAAIKLFAKKGYASTSVKEIASLAGVNVSLVSYHFGGKQALYQDCIHQFGNQRLASAQRILQPADSPQELRLRLHLYLDELFLVSAQNPELVQIIHQECEMGTMHAQDIFRSTFVEAFNVLVRFLENTQQRGILRSTTNPLMAASFLFGSTLHVIRSRSVGRLYWSRDIHDGKVRQEVITHFLDLFYHGALSAPASKREFSHLPQTSRRTSSVKTAQIRTKPSCGDVNRAPLKKKGRSVCSKSEP